MFGSFEFAFWNGFAHIYEAILRENLYGGLYQRTNNTNEAISILQIDEQSFIEIKSTIKNLLANM